MLLFAWQRLFVNFVVLCAALVCVIIFRSLWVSSANLSPFYCLFDNTHTQTGDEYVVALHSDDGGGGHHRHHHHHHIEEGGMTAPLAFSLFVASCSQFLVGYVTVLYIEHSSIVTLNKEDIENFYWHCSIIYLSSSSLLHSQIQYRRHESTR
jgi:hypothetical protein